MRRPVTVVLAFGADGKAAQPAGSANGVKPVFAPGEQLVDVALVANIPNELIPGRGKDIVQRQGQFHHTQIRPQMAAISGEHRDEFVPNFLRQRLQLFDGQLLDVSRVIHHIQVSVHRITRPPRLAPDSGA